MTSFDWENAGAYSPERLAAARTQLVSVAQWLARVERSYRPGSPLEPLSLRWSDERGAIATQGIADDVALELRMDDLVMQFTENGRPSDHEIDVEERSPAHVEAWILIELLHRGIDRDRFSKDLPYDTSALLSGDGVEFSPGEYAGELATLAALFRSALQILREASGDPAAIRIVPGDLRVEGAAGDRIIGFSLGDATRSEPHFYVAPTGGGSNGSGRRAALGVSEVAGADARERILSFLKGDAPTRH